MLDKAATGCRLGLPGRGSSRHHLTWGIIRFDESRAGVGSGARGQTPLSNTTGFLQGREWRGAPWNGRERPC